METLLLFAGIVSLLVFIITLHHFLKKVKFGRHFGIDLSVILIGLSYLVFSIIILLAVSKIFNFEQIDFLKIYSLVLLVQTASLLNILYFYNRNSKIFYSVLVLVLIVPFMIYSFDYFHLIIPACFLITLMSFLIFADSHRKSETFVILYSSISILSYVISTIWNSGIMKLFILSSLLFVFFLYFFLEQVRSSDRMFLNIISRKKNDIVDFLKHFVFIIIITNFIFVGTIGVHEMGHLFMASAFDGCVGNRIVYEINEFPHTEVVCPNQTDKDLWIIAGVLLPVFLVIILFFVGGTFIREIALEILGFNLAISYIDFIDMGISRAVSSFLMIGGVVLCFLGLALLARSRTQ